MLENNLELFLWRHLTNSTKQRLPDVRLLPPSGELDETHASSLILVHSLDYVTTWRHVQNRKYITYCIGVRGRPRFGHR